MRPAASARDVAFDVLRDVFGPQQRGAAESLDHHLRAVTLDGRDRAFATELAFGTIERRRWLDFQLHPYVGDRAKKLPEMIAEILRLGTYQLRAMRVHDYAAVAESVQLARRFGHPGTAGLVNAVLRRVAAEPERTIDPDDFADPDDALATRWSLPTWLVRRWRARFGAERLEAILGGVNAPAATGLAVDLRRTTRAALLERLQAAGIAAQPSPFAADAIVIDGPVASAELEPLLADDAELHAEAAAFPVDLLDPQPGERILELCSGRGNKTLQIASRTGDRAPIVAVDRDGRKIERARIRLARAGVRNVALRMADATALDAAVRYDAVLVDAPCSGSGIVGRQPEARWRKLPDDGRRLAPLQRALLESAAGALAPGGRLVYAVCSVDEVENEAIVEPFLAAHADVHRAPLPGRYAPFATPAGDVFVAPGIDGRDGFFISLLERAA